MRRLWAYILLALTSLILVGVGFVPLMRNTNANIDYQSGREILFHVESKDETRELSEKQLGELADMMSERLQNQNITRYEVDIQGDDTIAVILSQDYEKQYSNIIQYMEFDGSFALTNSAGMYALADEFLVENGKASLETYNNYPCITLPVQVDGEKYKEVLEGAKGEGAKPETTSSGEGEDAEETNTYYLYLWYGFEEKLITEETDYSTDSHIIMKFKVSDLDDGSDQYFPDSDNKLFSALNLDTDGDGVASASEKSQAFDTANYYVNLLNASKLEVTDENGGTLDVTIKNFGSNYVDAWIEQTIALNTVATVAFTPTFIALLCALVLVSVLLVYFFRLGAVSVITTTIGSLFAGLAAMILLTAEFTTISIFAFIALAITSLASGIINLCKIKDEAYRGRSLKKANLEAGRKSLLPILDVHVALIVIGVFAYLLGGSAMRTFAAITVLGGVASVILNTLGLKLLLWLVTNATCLQGKYGVFGIDGSKVPDLISEEKPTYFGQYADKDLTKSKVKMGIAGGTILLATTVAMIVFGIVTGSIYASKNSGGNDRVYFETTMAETSQINNTSINDILAKTFVYNDKDGDNLPSEEERVSAKSLASYGIAKIDSTGKSYTVTNDADEDITHYVTVAYLNGSIDSNLKAYYDVNGDGSEIISTAGGDNDVNSIINYAIETKGVLENVATVSLKKVTSHNVGQPDVLKIAMAALVGAAVSGFYLLLRYRLSRGLISTLLAIATGSVAIGLLSLVHLPVVGGYVAVIGQVAALFSFIMSIIFMNKERELVLEDKTKDKSLENRRNISIKAVSYSYSALITFAVVAVFVCVNFFGFGSNFTALPFIALIITMLLALVVNPIVIAPLSNVLYGWFSKVNIKRPTKKKKTKSHKTTKSAEPEEAIFIGIND